jgi:hypothetical protein
MRQTRFIASHADEFPILDPDRDQKQPIAITLLKQHNKMKENWKILDTKMC